MPRIKAVSIPVPLATEMHDILTILGTHMETVELPLRRLSLIEDAIRKVASDLDFEAPFRARALKCANRALVVLIEAGARKEPMRPKIQVAKRHRRQKRT